MPQDYAKPPTGAAARAVLETGRRLAADAEWIAGTLDEARRAVIEHHRGLVAPQVRERLSQLPIERLRDSTSGRLRLAGLAEAGFRTILDVWDAAPSALDEVQGVGEQSATAIRGAAMQVADAVAESVQVRIEHDPENRATTPLVAAVVRLTDLLAVTRPLRALIDQVLPALRHDLPLAAPAASKLGWLFTGRQRKDAAVPAYWRLDQAGRWASENGLAERIGRVRAVADAPGVPAQAWASFAAEPAAFYTLLSETIGLRLDVAAVEGYLPGDIVEKINALRLDDTWSNVSLRGYQSFGARFALVQRRVILGDEMGLGKTIQALAALAHLRAQGETHFLVVCPASVVINWLREIRRHSRLEEFRLHGPAREQALTDWLTRGGVAVTTYETAGMLALPGDLRLGSLVVDEAHFVKNPETARARVVAALGERTGRVLFLTGTPMENRVSEFKSLVAGLRPSAPVDVDALDGVAGPARFRTAVAPVYLRRNADDVLVELPPLVQSDEWEDFAGLDGQTYREAVTTGNFSLMRRAAFASSDPDQSAKIARLLELVAEAVGSGSKVVIFSYFLGVLSTVVAALRESDTCPDALGPLTGATPVASRQQMVDDFSADGGPEVLVAQIQAGGIGLNMQAASVVILCEPQVKPTMESQAVARAHRMGQLNTVRVHRLLIDDSVDERMIEILDHKQRLFDQFARDSDLADATAAAVDISEVALARQVVAAEQGRLQLPLR